MKLRTVITLWITALVLGVVASIVQFGSDDENATRTALRPGDKILPALPIRDITHVTVSQGTDTTELVKQDNGSWGVAQRGNYPVDYEKLRNLLGALGELEVTQGYPASSAHFGRFGLVEESDVVGERALRVTMKKADGSTAADVFLGKFSGTSRSSGRFVRTASDNSGVYAVGETFPGITASAQDWLGSNFLKIDKMQSVSVTAPNDPTFEPWKLVRHPNTDGTTNENGQLKLDGLKKDEVMQLTSTNPLRNLFSYTSFQDILTESQAQDKANPDAKLKREATITTFDGLTYKITFWPQKDTNKEPQESPNQPSTQPNYLFTVSVTADIQEKRVPAPNEKPEEAKKKDADHAASTKSAKEKLAAAKDFEGRIFSVSQSIVSPLQKKRSDFVKKNKPSPSAVTPPIRVPPAPANTNSP